MALPTLWKGVNLFVDGQNQYGIVADVTPPKITYKTDDWQGGGLVAPVKVEQGLEALEASFSLGGFSAEVMAQMGGSINGKTVRVQGALQRDDRDEYVELVAEMRGRITEADAGTAKQADNGEHKFTMPLTYYRLVVDGKEVIEIDILGGKCVINGKDQYANMRKALGV